jgi:tetratricopeptide (TPR) repeat protein
MSTKRRSSVGSAPLAVELLLSVVLSGLRVAPAQAQTQPSPPPWHQGVSEERQQKAQALFQEGRELYRALMLADARAKYEEALTYWEQPELRLYLGRVLMRIGLPLLAYENLQKALKGGPGALDPEDDKEARAEMQNLVQQDLAAIKIRCDEPGAAVMLDGKPWFVGPGEGRRMVLPGEHVVTAKKVGYYRVVKPVVVVAGKEGSGVIQLSVDATISRRLWPAWRPWAVVGAGAAVGLLGAGLQALASKDFEEADDKFRGACRTTCPPASASEYNRGQWENGFAIGSFIVGGATLVAGSVMVLLNRPQSYRTEDQGNVKVEVLPVVSAHAAGLSARLSF